MTTRPFVSPDDIRDRYSKAMSDMYRQEVPQYGTLLTLVADVNAAVLERDSGLQHALAARNELERIDVERHGAIRLGTPAELSTVRRIFAVMGMHPVGYYDLSVAGVPVHSTAFRPVDDEALERNPFRVFTSLLRLELIQDEGLRAEASAILERRNIFPARVLELIDTAQEQGGLNEAQAQEFVRGVTDIFRWHQEATVDAETYSRLHRAHRLIADVVCFKGPHINHLTPRTLDIDAAQVQMAERGMSAKEVIEGPPRRRFPILLRQTSFKALEEAIAFKGEQAPGMHSARFGEIEQRGMALTPSGRARYDALLAQVRDMGNAGSADSDYAQRLEQAFSEFPDDLHTLHEQGLAYFRYSLRDAEGLARAARAGQTWDARRLVRDGVLDCTPIVYEDFLPVSAAGIFQSNLGGAEQKSYVANAARNEFEAALGASVMDEFSLYAEAQARSETVLREQFLRSRDSV